MRKVGEVAGRAPADRWVPLLILPALVVYLGRGWEPWLWMWGIAFAIYAGCKWLTLRDAASRTDPPPPVGRRVGYFALWPGMDGEEFFRARQTPLPGAASWVRAAAATFGGLALLLLGVRQLPAEHAFLAAWAGMAGIVMVLHFGVFHLLSLSWQRSGRAAPPIMRRPLRAESLAEFWGRRWNLAFHELTLRYLYRPLRRTMAAPAALLTAFLASGLVHELVITVPARGGYGGPTVYFLVQGVGLLAERHRALRRRPVVRRVLVWVLVLGPVPLLFPPAFLRNVVLPMLDAWGLR